MLLFGCTDYSKQIIDERKKWWKRCVSTTFHVSLCRHAQGFSYHVKLERNVDFVLRKSVTGIGKAGQAIVSHRTNRQTTSTMYYFSGGFAHHACYASVPFLICKIGLRFIILCRRTLGRLGRQRGRKKSWIAHCRAMRQPWWKMKASCFVLRGPFHSLSKVIAKDWLTFSGQKIKESKF